MTMAKKKTYNGRNTAMFYALIAQLPGYSSEYKEVIKESVINEFLEKVHGVFHNRPLSLSALSDLAYHELIKDLRQQVYDSKSKKELQREAIRKKIVSQIFQTFSKIWINDTDGGHAIVNSHIRSLPISKGRIIPQFHDDELERLLGAVRAYCGNIHKQQVKGQRLAPKN